jgi:hypothetical protein
VPRYAVLHDLSDQESRPVGIAFEMPDYVAVHAPREYGIPERQDGEYQVRQPNMAFVGYRPGEPGYFEQVLGDLAWAFGIGEQGIRVGANYATLFELIVEKVEREQGRQREGEYGAAASATPHRRLSVVPGGRHPRYEADPAATEHQLALSARGIVTV